MKTKNFVCMRADKEALQWLSEHFKELKSFRLKTFEVSKSGSHCIDIEYETRKVR
jgi:predicted transport protein